MRDVLLQVKQLKLDLLSLAILESAFLGEGHLELAPSTVVAQVVLPTAPIFATS